jgi:hypothetical protein
VSNIILFINCSKVEESTVSQVQLRRHPQFVEQTRGTLNQQLSMPIGYYRFLGIIKSTFFHYATTDFLSNRRNDEIQGFFTVLDYKKLGMLLPAKRTQLMRRLAAICCDVYDTEWWYTLLQRATFLKKKTNWRLSRGYTYPGDLTDFPRTCDEFDEWCGKQGSRALVQADQSYSMGTPTVTSKTKVIELMVRDMTNRLPETSKSRWCRCITRHLVHYVMEEITRIEENAPVSTKDEWSIGVFQEVLAESFQSDRRKPGDDSPAIIWPTEKGERMIRWKNFTPKIVKLIETSIPTRTLARHVPDPVAHTTRDHFFRYLLLKGDHDQRFFVPQINTIILVRCLFAMTEKSNKRDRNNRPKNEFSVYWRHFKIHSHKKLVCLFDNEKKMLAAAGDVWKYLFVDPVGDFKNLIEAAQVNKEFWKWRTDGEGVDLFQHSPADTQRTNDGMTPDGNHRAFVLAQHGYITSAFLELLISVRLDYVEKRSRLELYGKDATQDFANIRH